PWPRPAGPERAEAEVASGPSCEPLAALVGGDVVTDVRGDALGQSIAALGGTIPAGDTARDPRPLPDGTYPPLGTTVVERSLPGGEYKPRHGVVVDAWGTEDGERYVL